MNSHLESIAVAFKTLSLVMGALVTLYAYRAYRRTDVRSLGLLAIGFGMFTLGALLAGVLDQLVAVGRGYALVVESALTTVGFGVVLYSLFAE